MLINTYLSKTISLSVIAASLSLSVGQAAAHDFWLNPMPFVVEAPGDVPVDIRIGHAEDMSNWPANPDRIISFKAYGSDGLKDLQATISETGPIKPVTFETPGVHMIAIETTHAASELPAQKFNDYLAEEGLTPIQSSRAKSNTEETPGREIYSRRGKALVLVGDMPDTDPAYLSKPVGMTLEIVPLTNPYRMKAGDTLDARVYYRGKPLAGAQVMLVSLDTMVGDITQDISDADGHVDFKRPAAGDWMLHVVWSDPIEGHPLGDFDTTFSSLSFGFR